MACCGGWSQTPVIEATVVKQIFGDLQVAVHIQEACDVCATDVLGDGLP